MITTPLTAILRTPTFAGVPTPPPSYVEPWAALSATAGRCVLYTGAGPMNSLLGTARTSGTHVTSGNRKVSPPVNGSSNISPKDAAVTHIGELKLAASISAERLHPFLVGNDGGLLLPGTLDEMITSFNARYSKPEDDHFIRGRVSRYDHPISMTPNAFTCIVFHADIEKDADRVSASYFYSEEGRLLQVWLDNLKLECVSSPCKCSQVTERRIAVYTPGRNNMPTSWHVKAVIENSKFGKKFRLARVRTGAEDVLLLLANMSERQFNAVVSPEGAVDPEWLKNLFTRQFSTALLNRMHGCHRVKRFAGLIFRECVS